MRAVQCALPVAFGSVRREGPALRLSARAAAGGAGAIDSAGAAPAGGGGGVTVTWRAREVSLQLCSHLPAVRGGEEARASWCEGVGGVVASQTLDNP